MYLQHAANMKNAASTQYFSLSVEPF